MSEETTIGKRFDPAAFFETAAQGRSISTHPKRQIIFAQGDAANSVFYIKQGKALQFDREAARPSAIAVGQLRQGRSAGSDHREDQSGNTR